MIKHFQLALRMLDFSIFLISQSYHRKWGEKDSISQLQLRFLAQKQQNLLQLLIFLNIFSLSFQYSLIFIKIIQLPPSSFLLPLCKQQDYMIHDHPSPPPNFFPNMSIWSLSQRASTPAPATPLRMLAPAPLKKDLYPSLARIFWAQSMDPLNFSASPEVIIILLLMVSMGQEARPENTVTPQPRRKVAPRLSFMSPGSMGFTESQMPKQRPLQMMIPTQEITKPLQRPAKPSVAMVFLQTSMRPVNCFCPPFLEDLRSLESLVLAQSREQTKRRETEPAAPPEARFPRNQMKYPSLSLLLPKSLLKQSLREKLRAWVGKYLITLVPFPFQRAFTPSSATILLAQSEIPAQGLSRAPDLSMASTVWSLSLMTSMGEAQVLETAAETPPMRKSRKKVPMSFFLPLFSAILLKQNYINVEHNQPQSNTQQNNCYDHQQINRNQRILSKILMGIREGIGMEGGKGFKDPKNVTQIAKRERRWRDTRLSLLESVPASSK